MGLSRQEYWSGLPCLPTGSLPNPGIKPRSPALQADSLLSEPITEWPRNQRFKQDRNLHFNSARLAGKLHSIKWSVVQMSRAVLPSYGHRYQLHQRTEFGGSCSPKGTHFASAHIPLKEVKSETLWKASRIWLNSKDAHFIFGLREMFGWMNGWMDDCHLVTVFKILKCIWSSWCNDS